MTVKTLFTGLAMAILFSSCDPNSDKQVGNASRLQNTTSSTGGSGNAGSGGTGSTGTPTDAPFDGGLSVLLVAGTAYGLKRIKGLKQTEKNK